MVIQGRNADIPGTSGAQFPAPPANVPSLGNFPSAPRTGQIRDIRGNFAGGVYSAWYGFTTWGQLPQRLQSDLQGSVDNALASMQQEMVDYAKANAPWADHTGDAREALNSPPIIENADGSKTLILAHGVPYGVYLETMNGGVFGIISRTIDHFIKEFPDAVRTNIKK